MTTLTNPKSPEDKYRPVLTSSEIESLCELLCASPELTIRLNLTGTQRKLELLSRKIQANCSRPAYTSTGVSPGKAGWSGASAGILEVDSSGDLVFGQTDADKQRAQIAAKATLAESQARVAPLFRANLTMINSINTAIEAGVKIFNTLCLDATTDFYETCSAIATPVAYWKHVNTEIAEWKEILTPEQIQWIIDAQKL